jgi:tetratricopeptide (TPR) repeat protein
MSPELRRRLICGLGLTVVTVGLFLPLLSHDFLIYDDDRYVTKNPFVTQGITLHGLKVAFTKAYASNWHPLAWVSHMLDCQLYGLKPAGHFLTNVLLHLANVLLLFALLQRITGKLWRSFAVAGLFAWHPLHLESVAWVAERKDLLSTFFGLLSVAAYVRYVERTKAQMPETSVGAASTGWPWLLLALFLFAMALMSKPMLVTLPFVLLLLDFWPLQRLRGVKGADVEEQGSRCFRALVKEKAIFFLLTGVSCLITFRVQRFSGAMTMTDQIPLLARVANALVSYVRYLKQTVFPTNLAVFYPYTHSLPHYAVIGSVLLLVVFTGIAIWQAQRRPYLLVGWLWFLGTLVPVIGIVQVGAQAMADRYTYIPLIGLFIVAVWSGADLAEHWRLPKLAMAAVLSSVLAAFVIATKLQLPHWRNSGELFAHALAVTRNNNIAHINLGIVLYENGEFEQAGWHFAEAIKLEPTFFEAHANLGNVYAKLGKPQEALGFYETALRLAPSNPDLHFKLGNTLAALNRIDEAVAQYEIAQRGMPGDPDVQFNYGVLLVKRGRLQEAIRKFQKAAILKPGLVEAHQELGVLQAQTGHLEEAVREYQEVLKRKPELTEIEVSLGDILELLGRHEEAMSRYYNALRINADSAHGHSSLGIALARQGKNEEAALHFQEVIRLEPGSPNAHYNLGNALMGQGKDSAAAEQYSEVLRLNPGDTNAKIKLQLCRTGRDKSETAKP